MRPCTDCGQLTAGSRRLFILDLSEDRGVGDVDVSTVDRLDLCGRCAQLKVIEDVLATIDDHNDRCVPHSTKLIRDALKEL